MWVRFLKSMDSWSNRRLACSTKENVCLQTLHHRYLIICDALASREKQPIPEESPAPAQSVLRDYCNLPAKTMPVVVWNKAMVKTEAAELRRRRGESRRVKTTISDC